MRTASIILLVGVTAMLLGCGLRGDSGQVAEESEAGASSQATMVGPFVPPSAGSMIAYDGPSSLEERIFVSRDRQGPARLRYLDGRVRHHLRRLD